VWKTLQGEVFFAGRPAVFVRLVGCNMWSGYEQDRERDARRTEADCPLWCDTDFTKEGSQSYTAQEIVDVMCDVGGEGIRFCVLTGGEPLLQIDARLINTLQRAGFMVAIETNGTISLRESCWDDVLQKVVAPDWIVCSPKLSVDHLVLEYFDELKLVVPDYMPRDFILFAKRQRKYEVNGKHIPLLWLQPEDGPRLEGATRLAVDMALQSPGWRVSVQTHKIIGVD